MDLAQLGFRFRPYRSTLDTQLYYPATSHEAALSELREAFDRDDAILLLTGSAGVGKTLLLHRFIETLPTEVETLFLTNPRASNRAELFQALLFELHLAYQGKSEQELRLLLTEELLNRFANGQKTLLIIDEAHLLNADQLEELRLLTNLDGKQGRAVQVLLSAQPELLKALQVSSLLSVRQRIAVRPHLELLNLEESHDYLQHQVRIAGGRPEKLFQEEGLQILAEVGKGVPRLLNQLGTMALKLIGEMSLKQIDAEVSLEAASRLGLEIPEDEASGPVEEIIEDEAEEEPPKPAIARLPEPELPLNPVTLPMQPPISPPKLTDPSPRVLIYSGQPTGTPMERIEELLRSRRQGGG
jgi:type II secretory pathway predicted ATPase ExeA